MPIYEFECANCSERFEKLIRSRDKESNPCPACSSSSVKRVLSPFSCLGVRLTKKFKREAEEGLKREKKY